METGRNQLKRTSQVLRWIARILSILSIAFVLLFLFGELLTPSAPAIFTLRDIIGLVFFPFGVCLGVLLAWRWEFLGSAITIASLACFYLTLVAFDGRFPRGPYFLLVASPGFFFLAAWFLKRREIGTSETS